MVASATGAAYQVWGLDRIIYGPADLSVLSNWIREERVTPDTWIFNEDTDTWKKAREFPELQPFFPSASSAPTSSDPVPTLGEFGVKPGSLRRIKVFASMNDIQLQRFVDYMEVQPVRQWTQVVKQGDPGDAMYLVMEGEVRVRLLIAGKETTIATLPAGEFFGEISLFDHGPRSADVVANHDSVLLRISAAAFNKLAAEAPELASPFLLAVGKTLTSRIRADNKRLRQSVTFARASGL